MNIRFKALLIATVFFLFATSIVQAHWKTSHYQIAVNAVKKAAVASEALKAIGFENGFDSELFFETVRVVTDDIPSMNEPNMISKNYTLSEWIGYGSEWEDGILAYRRYPLLGYEGITYGHFYDPWNDCGFMGEKDGVYKEIGQSLIDRANDTVSDSADEWPEVVMGPPNEWSYPMAKNYYYAALTGDSTKYKKWPCMRQFFRPYYSGRHEGKKNMNETERNRFFTWTFQTLGHILHLVADSSVPAHTRNDAHSIDPLTLILPNGQGKSPFGDYDPFERWCWTTVLLDKLKDTGLFGNSRGSKTDVFR
ncbi:hypothetical protein DENIS_0923 [Desulfonema ishimotonii]|uniref:Phospholipase C/D domain-containing protein n=1 Tax=Desulfonema ishimotonii TaxID=45657 RepID=A0A401FSN0_9BACT|nr:hypothetical protein [Desulfonema ishimotonii]GBC59981.1 hypothetical protein DENIS_0923 [Desulfonema ishimotonii]